MFYPHALKKKTRSLLAGEVEEGFDVVKKIEGYGSASGKTSATVTIAKSGTV